MKKVKLGEVCEIVNGFAFKSLLYVNEGIRIIRITNVQKGYIEDSDPKYYPIEYRNSIEKYILKENDLLMSLTGNVGRVGLISKTMLPAALNQRVACLRTIDSLISKEYVFQFLNSDLFEQSAIRSSNGVAQKNLSTDWLKKVEITYPSVEQQKLITSTLNLIERLICCRKEQNKKLNKLVKSRFNELFGDLFLNEFKWDYASFNEFAKFDTKMISDFTNFIDLPHIGIDSIEKNTGKLIGYRTVREDQISSGKYLFTKKHIIYSKIRPNLNKVALPDFMGVCSADAYPILTVEEKMNRIFLAHVLRSDYFLNFILSFSSRTNLPKVNKSQISKFKCPLPPLSLQNEFADFVAQVDKSQFACQMAIKLWRNSLKSSII